MWFSWRHGSISISPSFHWLCSRASSLSAWASNETSVWNVVTSWRRNKLWAVKFPSTKDVLQIYWCTTPAGTSTQTYTKRKNDFAMPCRPTYVYICIYTSLYFSVLNHALRRGPWSFQPPHTSASSPGSPAVLTILPSLHATRPETVTVWLWRAWIFRKFSKSRLQRGVLSQRGIHGKWRSESMEYEKKWFWKKKKKRSSV